MVGRITTRHTFPVFDYSRPKKLYRTLSESGPLLDLGAVMQNICLAAMHFGLGTCIEDQGVLYPEVLREHAGIPPTKRLNIAIAIGYPDPDFPANNIRSEREPAENLTTWIA